MTQTDQDRRTILVVDDTPDNLSLMSGMLKDCYRVKVANGGERALAIAQTAPQPDLILLDVMMPVMDGYEVCRRLKADPNCRDIPVVFLTARADQVDEQFGLDLGAVDYITKPVSPPIVIARVRNHLQLKRASDVLRDQNAYLEAEVDRRTRDVRAIRDAAIVAMASLAETRDNETGNHIRRTQHYVRILAETLSANPAFRDTLPPDAIDLLYRSAALHDIGKVGIPDSILLKPGRLTDAEFTIMKTHTTLGHAAISSAERGLDNTNLAFLSYAREIALTHHERWDGTGYPQGLAGEAIPLSGRVMSVADVYDALTTKRVYKPAYPHEVAVEEISGGRGTQFDPVVVDAFLAASDRFLEVSRSLSD